jgi:hypothetical protein
MAAAAVFSARKSQQRPMDLPVSSSGKLAHRLVTWLSVGRQNQPHTTCIHNEADVLSSAGCLALY